jgi:adenylate cyclase
MTKAFELAQKAIALDDTVAYSHTLLAIIYTVMRKNDKAIAAGERGVALNPNGAGSHAMLGSALGYAGRLDEALYHIKQGIRLDPFPDFMFVFHLGRIYRMKGQYEKALSAFKTVLHLNPDSIVPHLSLAITYALLNRQVEAEAAARKVLEMNPNFSVERASKLWPYKNPADLKLIVDAALKAKLPLGQ